jgi:hypothetical protein
MNTQTMSSALKKAQGAINSIQRLVPQLSEAEIATLELMLDKKAQKHIAQSIADIKKGNFVTLEALKNL